MFSPVFVFALPLKEHTVHDCLAVSFTQLRRSEVSVQSTPGASETELHAAYKCEATKRKSVGDFFGLQITNVYQMCIFKIFYKCFTNIFQMSFFVNKMSWHINVKCQMSWHLKCQMSWHINAKCQMSWHINVKCQMSNVKCQSSKVK